MNKDKICVSTKVFLFFQHMVLILLTLPATQLLINSIKNSASLVMKWNGYCFGTVWKAFGAVPVSSNRLNHCDNELFKYLLGVLI